MHLIRIQAHNVVFERIVPMKMNLSDFHRNIACIRPAQTHIDLIGCYRFVKFYNIIRIIIFIFLFQQLCCDRFRLVRLLGIPVCNRHPVHAHSLVCRCKCKIIYLIVPIQRD